MPAVGEKVEESSQPAAEARVQSVRRLGELPGLHPKSKPPASPNPGTRSITDAGRMDTPNGNKHHNVTNQIYFNSLSDPCISPIIPIVHLEARLSHSGYAENAVDLPVAFAILGTSLLVRFPCPLLALSSCLACDFQLTLLGIYLMFSPMLVLLSVNQLNR